MSRVSAAAGAGKLPGRHRFSKSEERFVWLSVCPHRQKLGSLPTRFYSRGTSEGIRWPRRQVDLSPCARGQWHQLVRRLRPLRDERAAMAVGCGDKTRGHVVAEERHL